VRVAGLGYSDGARNLEVMLQSLSGGRRREIQEDGIVMEENFFYYFILLFLFIFLFILFSAVVERDELGEAKCLMPLPYGGGGIIKLNLATDNEQATLL